MKNGLPQNLRVFVCAHFTEEKRMISYAFHDLEGDFTFECSEYHPEEIGSHRSVSLRYVLEQDPTVEEVLSMKAGMQAQRESFGKPWVYRPIFTN